MKLVNIHINGFGKLCDFPLTFDEKLTCICEQNGYGKTTIAAFIKAMFYSLPTARKGQTPETNERIKYLPWNTQSFGGRLTFSLGAKTYTIIRIFDRQSSSNDEFQLIDTNSGKPSTDFTSKIGEEIFGVDEEGFFRSTFSNGNPTLSSLPASVRTRISSENENAQDLGQFDAAKKKLEDAIKQIKGKNGSIDKLTARATECKNELERCKIDIEEYNRINAHIEQINDELGRLQKQKSELDNKLSKSAGAEASRIKLETYNKLKEEIEQLSKNASDIEKRYNGKIPTNIQIEEISATLKQIEEKKVLLASETDRAKDSEFAEIFGRFKDNLPSDLMVSELADNAKIIELAQNKIEELSNKIETLKAELNRMHIENIDKIPSDTELYELRLAASRIVNAPQNISTTAKINVVPVILAAVFALLGVGVAFVNFTLGIVIAAVGAVVLVALLLLNSVKKTVSMGAGVPTVSNEQRQKVQNFLLTFGFSNETDVNVAVDKLKIAANLISEIDENQNEITAQNQKLNAAKTFVDNALSDFQINDVQLFLKQRERYVTLILPSLEKTKNLKYQVNELCVTLVSLFKNIGITDITSDSFNATLEKIKEDINEYNLALKQLDDKTQKAEESFEKDGISKMNLDETLEPLEKISNDIKQLESVTNSLLDKRAALYAAAGRLAQSQEEFNLYSAELENCAELEAEDRKRLFTLEKTLEFLNSAKDSMTQKYAVKVEEYFKSYGQKFISDNVQNISISPELELSVKRDTIARETDFFSSGERGVMDVCLRLALVDAMFEKEKPFVVLDDPFSLMDKENLADALDLVKNAANDKQIIYFTCHQSREIN